MIKVNLLPSEPGKRTGPAMRKVKLPTSGIVPAMAVLVVVYGAAIFAGYTIYRQSADSKANVEAAEKLKKKTQSRVDEEKAKFQKNMSNWETVEEKYQVAQALNPENRIFWSEKLNMIALARMDLAVFVTKLTLTEKIEELETAESVKRRDEWKNQKNHPAGQEQEPKPIKRPIINQSLLVDAIAYGTDAPQRLRQILAYQNTLSNMTWKREKGTTTTFTSGLKPDLEIRDQKLDKVGGVEVMRFSILCTAEPQADGTADKAPVHPATAPAGGKKP